MTKTKRILSAAFAVCAAASCVSVSASAEETLVYGTMDIPYDLFYAGETAGAANTVTVDAVSSATNAKWSKNGEGELFEGTYHSEAAEDGSGKILGVTYAVAISQTDLDALGTDNYNFKKLDAAPAAYKTVTVANGKAAFSAVNDSAPEVKDGTATINTNSTWGDYQVSIKDYPEDADAVLGALIITTDNSIYPMRHETNIWRKGEIAWSVGFKTEEPHGNKLDSTGLVDSQGKTIDKVTYITKNGYVTYDVDAYLPKKFAYTAEVTTAAADAGSTAIALTGFPEDYDAKYSVKGLDISVADGKMTYSSAKPGSYSLTISDSKGVYQDVPVTFELTTDAMPAAYDASAKALKAADGASADDLANYIKNISTVSVDGTDYAASGKRGVKLITDDGALDLAAENQKGKIFAEDKTSFEVEVTAAGYTKKLKFTVSTAEEAAQTETSVEAAGETNTETTAPAVITETTNTAASGSTNPATGAGMSLTTLAASAIMAFVSRKRK